MTPPDLTLWIFRSDDDDVPWVVELGGPPTEGLTVTPALVYEGRTLHATCAAALYWSRCLGLPININTHDRPMIVEAMRALVGHAP